MSNLDNKQLLDRFSLYLVSLNYSNRTINEYLVYVGRYLEFFSKNTKHDINEPTAQTMEEFRRTVRGAEAQRLSIAAIKKFYQFRHFKYNDKVPYINVQLPKKERKMQYVPSREEIVLFKKTVQKTNGMFARLRLQAITEVLLMSGIRENELLQIRRADVIVDEQGLCKILIHGKGSKQRYIYLNTAMRKSTPATVALFEFINYCDEKAARDPNFKTSEYVFYSQISGRRMVRRNIRAAFDRVTRKAGIPHYITPHSIRRAVATTLFAEGTKITDIQILLGHSSLITTERYIRKDEDAARTNVVNQNPFMEATEKTKKAKSALQEVEAVTAALSNL